MKRNSNSHLGRQALGKDGLLLLRELLRGGTVTQLAERLKWERKKVYRWVGAAECLGFAVIVTQDEDNPRASYYKVQRSSVWSFFI